MGLVIRGKWDNDASVENNANFLRELYQWPGIKDTFDLNKIKSGYYSQQHINPTGIVPVGPTLDHLEWPHDRNRLAAVA